MKKLVILFLVLCSLSLTSFVVKAQTIDESSPSPDEDLIKQKVEERIEKVLVAADEKKKRALIGTLKSISNSTLTIKTEIGNLQAKVATDAAILNLEREEIEVEDLEIGSKLISIGYLDSQGVLEAKRVIVTKAFQISDAEVAFGIVTDISKEEKILTIKHPKTETIYMVEVDSETEITKKVEGEIETIEFSDIEKDDRLVAIGELGENGEKIIQAGLIRIMSGEATEQSSPSSSPEASPAVEIEEE